MAAHVHLLQENSSSYITNNHKPGNKHSKWKRKSMYRENSTTQPSKKKEMMNKYFITLSRSKRTSNCWLLQQVIYTSYYMTQYQRRNQRQQLEPGTQDFLTNNYQVTRIIHSRYQIARETHLVALKSPPTKWDYSIFILK